MIPEPRIREIMAGQAYDSDIVKLCREVLELREAVRRNDLPAEWKWVEEVDT